MKFWLKNGLIIGFVVAVVGTLRLYFKFRAMNKALEEGLGNLAQLARPGGDTLTASMLTINFIQYFIIAFVAASVTSFIIQKVMKK